MRKLGFVRLVVLLSLCLTAAVFAAQSFGTIHPQEGQAVTTQSADVLQVDWPVLGFLAVGAVILLVIPRNRRVVPAPQK